MRYAPTGEGLAGCQQDMREGFFILPPLGFRRGVSHTPIKRPGRGERSFDGRVPVGRMRVRPTGIGLSAFGFRRGVSHTPPKRPDRGERLFDGRVPVGRMRYAPTSVVLPALGFRRGERFFAPTPVRKGDRPKSVIHPPLGFRRGVSHTPHKRPDRGERLSDGRVPVGRMRYAPTGEGLAGCRQDMREGFFILPSFRKADFRAATALTFWGKLISGRRQCLLFGGS